MRGERPGAWGWPKDPEGQGNLCKHAVGKAALGESDSSRGPGALQQYPGSYVSPDE